MSITHDGKPSTLEADALLVAVGRAPNSENLGLDSVGIKTERGFISTGDYYQTACPNIYAVGDVINTPQLAHVASKESEIVVEHIAGNKVRHARFPADLYPAAVYTDPELAWFGPTAEALKERGLKEGTDYQAVTFPYRGAGKSVAIGASDGRVKIYFSKKHHEILGGAHHRQERNRAYPRAPAGKTGRTAARGYCRNGTRAPDSLRGNHGSRPYGRGMGDTRITAPAPACTRECVR